MLALRAEPRRDEGMGLRGVRAEGSGVRAEGRGLRPRTLPSTDANELRAVVSGVGSHAAGPLSMRAALWP